MSSVKLSKIEHKRLCWITLEIPKENSLIDNLLSFDSITTFPFENKVDILSSYNRENGLHQGTSIDFFLTRDEPCWRYVYKHESAPGNDFKWDDGE